MRFDWHGPSARSKVVAHLAGNLDAAGEAVRVEIRRLISTPGPPRSSPNTPPHLDSGDLHDSIDILPAPATLVVYVGTEVEYAAYLEAGTPRLEPRPHHVRGLIQSGPAAARALVR
jgi:hypothetical protein